MAERTQEWANRVGREAVGLGFPCGGGLMLNDWHSPCGRSLENGLPWWPSAVIPDFRDRLTELACIAWVEAVAREVYGDALQSVTVEVASEYPRVEVGYWRKWQAEDGARGQCWQTVETEGDSPSEACIAAVRAMKEAQC